MIHVRSGNLIFYTHKKRETIFYVLFKKEKNGFFVKKSFFVFLVQV